MVTAQSWSGMKANIFVSPALGWSVRFRVVMTERAA